MVIRTSTIVVVFKNIHSFYFCFCLDFMLFVKDTIEVLVLISLSPLSFFLLLDESSLSSMSIDSRVAMVLLRVCLRVAISFFKVLVFLSTAYVAKILAWFVRHVSIVCISLRTITVSLATTSSIILFIFFYLDCWMGHSPLLLRCWLRLC